jgi:hypothetical protein
MKNIIKNKLKNLTQVILLLNPILLELNKVFNFIYLIIYLIIKDNL